MYPATMASVEVDHRFKWAGGMNVIRKKSFSKGGDWSKRTNAAGKNERELVTEQVAGH